MADDVLDERESPCPCGKGKLISQLVEHDTWASGRHLRYSLRCDTCEPRYRRRLQVGFQYLISADDAEQLAKMEHEIGKQEQAVGKIAEDRYGQQFVEFVKGLKFRTAMKDVIGNGYESINRFRQRTSTEPELEAVARQRLRADPTKCLARLKVQDAEIEQASEAIRALKQELATAEQKIPKVEFPTIEEA